MVVENNININNNIKLKKTEAMSTLYQIAACAGTKNIWERAFVHKQSADFGSSLCRSDAELLKVNRRISAFLHQGMFETDPSTQTYIP